jgi:hypothetical protein
MLPHLPLEYFLFMYLEEENKIMPKEIEEKLREEVNTNHPEWSEEKKNAYIFGTMRQIEEKQKTTRKEHWYFRKLGKKSPKSD